MQECTLYLLEYSTNGGFKQTSILNKKVDNKELNVIIEDYELHIKMHDSILFNSYQNINGVDTAHQLLIDSI